MEPRQLRLPGFTRLWASEIRRIRISQRQPLRPVGQRILVPVRAVEQQRRFIARDQAASERGTPPRQDSATFRAQQHSIVACHVLDRLQDILFIDGDHSWDGIRADWEGWAAFVEPGGVVCLHDSRATPERPIADAGSVRYTEDVIARDPRFEVVERVETLTVLVRREGPEVSGPPRGSPGGRARR